MLAVEAMAATAVLGGPHKVVAVLSTSARWAFRHAAAPLRQLQPGWQVVAASVVATQLVERLLRGRQRRRRLATGATHFQAVAVDSEGHTQAVLAAACALVGLVCTSVLALKWAHRKPHARQLGPPRAPEAALQSQAPPNEEPLEAQPLETQPLETQPLEAQPLEAQPLEAQHSGPTPALGQHESELRFAAMAILTARSLMAAHGIVPALHVAEPGRQGIAEDAIAATIAELKAAAAEAQAQPQPEAEAEAEAEAVDPQAQGAPAQDAQAVRVPAAVGAAVTREAATGVVAACMQQVERSASGEVQRVVPSPDVYAKLQRARIHRRQSHDDGFAEPSAGAPRSHPVRSSPVRFEHGNTNRSSADRGSVDRGSADRGSADRGSADRGSADRGSADRGSADRGSADRGSADQGNARHSNADHSGLTPTRLAPKLERAMETPDRTAARQQVFGPQRAYLAAHLVDPPFDDHDQPSRTGHRGGDETPPSSSSTTASSGVSIAASSDSIDRIDRVDAAAAEACRTDLAEVLQRHPSSSKGRAPSSGVGGRGGVLPLSIVTQQEAGGDSADSPGRVVAAPDELPRHYSPGKSPGSLQWADSGEVSPVGLRV